MNDALDRAIAYFGTQAALAAAIGVRSPAISSWKRTGRIPADQCRAIEKATKGTVRRVDLDPVLFGPIPGLEDVPLAA